MFTRVVILLVLAVSAVAGVDFNFTCVSGKDTDPVACTSTGVNETVAKAAALCHSPIATVVDNTFTDYGCGDCPANTTDTCVTCPAWTEGAAASNCNAYTDPLVSFKCNVNGVATACTAATKITCFGANSTYAGNDVSLTAGGCGTCADALAAATNATWTVADCVECHTDSCNSGAALVAVLAPLFAAMWAFSA